MSGGLDLKIVQRKLSEIKLAPYNPRKISKDDKDKLKKSLKEFGYVDPIIYNARNMFVVGGNQRTIVLRELAKEDPERWNVPYEMVEEDLDEEREKALNIALNKISGEWDIPKLKDILTELDTGAFDISLTGFDEIEIKDYIDYCPEASEDDFDLEQAESEIKEPKSKLGDIYILGNHRLMCGNSAIKEEVEKLLDGKKAELGLCDPPYNVGLNYDVYDDSLDLETYIDFNKQWFTLLKASTSKQIITPGSFNENIWFSILPPYHIAPWIKTNALSHGKISKFMCSEPILFYGEKWGRKRTNDVFDYPIGSQKDIGDHPCPKPLKLFADFITNFSEKNDYILDLFGGSGSTLIACEQLKRNCLMMELSQLYCDVIIKRWEKFTGKKAILKE